MPRGVGSFDTNFKKAKDHYSDKTKFQDSDYIRTNLSPPPIEHDLTLINGNRLN